MGMFTLIAIGMLAGFALFQFCDWIAPILAKRTHRKMFAFCPLAVIELVNVPPGQEEEMRKRNTDLFTLEEARRMLGLYAPVAKNEIAHLEMLIGIDALRERKHGYLVRLGRRGFHGD